MNQQLREAKQSIRAFIREQFSDQKLAEVIAFNQDRKMAYYNGCSCLLGVTLSNVLHTSCGFTGYASHHYNKAKALVAGHRAELGYARLGYKSSLWERPDNELAAQRLHAILKGEQYRRSKLVQPILADVDTNVCHVLARS